MTSEDEYKNAKIDREGRRLEFIEAFGYSFGVISLQKPDPKPATNFTQFLVGVETVLGPL